MAMKDAFASGVCKMFDSVYRIRAVAMRSNQRKFFSLTLGNQSQKRPFHKIIVFEASKSPWTGLFARQNE